MIAPNLQAHFISWQSHLTHERALSPKTVEAYVSDVSEALRELAGGEPLDLTRFLTLKPLHIRGYLAKRRSDDIQSRTLARNLSALRSFASFIESEGAGSNPAFKAMKQPKIGVRLPRPLTPQKAVEITQQPQDTWVEMRDSAVFLLLYGAGLRISESLALTPHAFAQAQSTNRITITGKGSKQRMLPLLPVIIEAINAYLNAQPFTLSPQEPMFRGEKGGVLSARIIQLKMESLRGSLGLNETATPHALRHSFATHLLGKGGDLRSIQQLLGHASLTSTQVYTALDQNQLLDIYKDSHPRALKNP